MGLKLAGADLAFKGGLLNGSKYVGLLQQNATEFSGDGYARVEMSGFGNSGDWQTDGAVYENRQTVQFPAPSGNPWPAIGRWGLYSAATGGDLLFDVDITDTAAPGVGADVEAVAEAIGWSFTGLTAAGSIAAMMEGLVSGTRYLSLHTGDPGTTGARAIFTDGVVWNGSNESGKTLVQVQAAAAQWTLSSPSGTVRRAALNASLSFGVQVNDLPSFTHVALRDGDAVDAAVLASDDFTAVDPGVGFTLSFAADALRLNLTVEA